MSIDIETARKVAHLARIKVEEDRLPALAQEFSNILDFIEQLNEVDVHDVEPKGRRILKTLLVDVAKVRVDGSAEIAARKRDADRLAAGGRACGVVGRHDCAPIRPRTFAAQPQPGADGPPRVSARRS